MITGNLSCSLVATNAKDVNVLCMFLRLICEFLADRASRRLKTLGQYNVFLSLHKHLNTQPSQYVESNFYRTECLFKHMLMQSISNYNLDFS